MEILKTSGLKQIILLILIAFLGIVMIWQLKYFIPAFLGAITGYILLRQFYFSLTLKYKWKKWLAALVLILCCGIIIAIPIFALVKLLLPKIDFAMEHSAEWLEQAKRFVAQINRQVPQLRIDDTRIQQGLQKALTILPTFLGGTMSVLFNILAAFFILYFMLISGRDMERKLIRLLPLREENKDSLWCETKNMVVSNAVGIPVLMICQSGIAVLGYWIFGVPQALFWGILTGVATILPMVGTMIIWVPICIVAFMKGNIGSAIGLTLYCAIIVSNIDNVLRFTIMKKIGDVHPLITVFGVILGMQLFGIMGLIFGPLLIAYFILLIKIYRLEFSSAKPPPADC